jgi:hypothetical protein
MILFNSFNKFSIKLHSFNILYLLSTSHKHTKKTEFNLGKEFKNTVLFKPYHTLDLTTMFNNFLFHALIVCLFHFHS